jgi:probable F420-dependent oxidoreductase
VKYGIAFANTMGWATGAGALDAARAAEAAGFESMWTVEHVVYPDGYSSEYPYSPDGKMPAVPSTPIPDPLIWLSYIAGVTSTITLATGILILPQRNPVVLAKELATLDSLSGGRLELGIGVGWLKEEFDALGVPWERRGQRTDDYVGAMRRCGRATARRSTASSRRSRTCRRTRSRRARSRSSSAATPSARRSAPGRLGDGFFPGKGSPAELAELMDVVRQTAADAGATRAIELTCSSGGHLRLGPGRRRRGDGAHRRQPADGARRSR